MTALAVLAIGALTVLGVAGQSRFDGAIILEVSRSHGLHRGDLLTLGIAAVALLAVAGLNRLAAYREQRPERERELVRTR